MQMETGVKQHTTSSSVSKIKYTVSNVAKDTEKPEFLYLLMKMSNGQIHSGNLTQFLIK